MLCLWGDCLAATTYGSIGAYTQEGGVAVFYLLNSAVITAPGTYRYRLITQDGAAVWLKAHQHSAVSRIGYSVTAAHIGCLGGWVPSLSREATHMEPGDEALVVRLKYRLEDPSRKGLVLPSDEDWEYGILERSE